MFYYGKKSRIFYAPAMHSVRKVVCGQLLHNNVAIELKSTFDLFVVVIEVLEYLHVTEDTK